MLKTAFSSISLLLALLFLNGCSDASFTTAQSSSSIPSWQLVYQNDPNGKALKGTKQDLLDAIRSGAPIRFAWGFKSERADSSISTEHVAEPDFLTIIGESEVVVQIPEHIAQQSYINVDKAIFDTPSIMWRGLLSTSGTFDAVWVNRASGEEVKRLQQKAAVAWFAYHQEDPNQRVSPVVLASPDSIRSVGKANPDAAKAAGESNGSSAPTPANAGGGQ